MFLLSYFFDLKFKRMLVTGLLIVKGDVVRIKDFTKRNFVLLYNDRGHVEHLSFELHQDLCDIIDKFNVKDSIQVEFNLKGRKWTDAEGTDKYFNSLQAWKIDYA